jgi:hypothetical protein
MPTEQKNTSAKVIALLVLVGALKSRDRSEQGELVG